MTDRRILVGDPTSVPVKHGEFITGDRLVGPDGIPFGDGISTRQLHIDGTRTDVYTADGTAAYPFKTIMAAVAKVIANGDNSQANPYTFIIAPAVYAENIVLEDSKLVSLIWLGQGSRLQTQIKPASGLALRSNANNANFYDFHCENIQFSMPTEMVGAASGNYFGYNFFFENCYWPSTATALFKNMTYPSFFGDWSKFSGGVTFSNVTQASINNIGGYKSSGVALTIETDESANMPYLFGTGTAVLASHQRTPNVTWSLLNIVAKIGTALQLRACRHGSAGETIPVNAQIIAYHSSLVGSYVVNGKLDLYDSFPSGTLSGTGTISIFQQAAHLKYTPGAGAEWTDPDPTNVQAALDRIAHEVFVLKGGPIS
jgi:hypothetical protein